MSLIYVLVFLATVAFSNALVDYCELNCPTSSHIQCDKNEGLGSRCPEGSVVIDYSETDGLCDLMLDLHNNFRSKVACGNVTSLPKAAAMAKMFWSPEHSKNAKYNIKECGFEPDYCHDVVKGKKSGQNIASFEFYEGQAVPSTEELTKRAFEQWEDTCSLIEEVADPIQVIQSYPEREPSCSSCLLMAKATNNNVGCSAGSTPDGEGGIRWWIICNYEEENMTGQIVYNAVPE